MPKILPSQLSESELLELLNSTEEVEQSIEIFDYKDDIVPFLRSYNITPGHTLVSKKLVYKLYKTYSKAPLPEREFNIQTGRFIAATGKYYSMNLDNFAVSNHIYKAEKTRDKTKSLTYQKHFTWFITEQQISKGNSWIEGFIIYYIYQDFCRQRRVKPKFGYINFHKFLKLHFPYKRIKGNRSLWFKIDSITANLLTEEDKNVIRKAREKTRGREEESKSKTEEVAQE